MKNNPGQHMMSVCIPTSDMSGLGAGFLRNNFDILIGQTFKDFDVVISDNSTADAIEKVCEEYKNKLEIHYYKNNDPKRGMCTNVNNILRKATGKLIKIIFLDDFLFSATSLEEIVKNFDLEKDHWLVTACEHTKDGVTFFRPYYPRYNDKIHLGKNTISSPSVLTLKNEAVILFDENLTWLMDCDYYKRLHDRFGKPKILNTINVVNRMGAHQTSNTVATTTLRMREYNYIMQKYHEKKPRKLQLRNVTLVAVSGLNPAGAIKALEYSMQGVDYYQAVLIAHYAPSDLDPRITFKKCKDTELQSKDPKNTNDYSKFTLYNLCDYIESDYALIVHNDAFVLRPDRWTDKFYEYDYLGAPFREKEHFTNEGVEVRVGNGGFSLRSKKMLSIFKELDLPFTDNGTGYYHEDGVICVYYRKLLEDKGIKFVPTELAAQFALEKVVKETVWDPFGFHNNKGAIPRFYFVKFKITRFFRRSYRKTRTALKLLIKRPKSFKRMVKERLVKPKPAPLTFDKNKIKELIKNQNPVIMEIGAANGDDTADFLKMYEGSNLKLYTFEPEPNNIAILKKRFDQKKIHLFEGAISDVDGKLSFNRSRTDNPNDLRLSGSIMKPKNHLKMWNWVHFDQTVEVKSMTLDSFVKKNNIQMVDFVWCDVQGAEEKVLRGGQETFKNKVKYLYTEYSNDEQYEGQPKLKQILKLLPGYEVVQNYGNDVLLRNTRL
jgi:FkbM family methyltransferase